jgi:hypothetical protein
VSRDECRAESHPPSTFDTRTFQFSHLPWFIIVSCFAIEFGFHLKSWLSVYWTKVQYTSLPLYATKGE